MKKKKKLIIIAILLIVLSLFFIPVILFLKNITIFQPISISISGITIQESKTIEIYGVTPFGRKKTIHFNQKMKEWNNDDNTFLKAINIYIPDSLEQKINQFHISITSNKYGFKSKDLQVVDLSGSRHHYKFPAYIRSKDSLVKMIPLIMQWPIVLVVMKIIQAIIVVLFLWFFFQRVKKKKIPLQSYLLFFRIKLTKQLIISPIVILWIKIVGFSVIFAFSLFFGYLLIKYTIASYITAVLFILCLCLFLWIILQIIFKICGTPRSLQKINRGIIIFLMFWFCLESLLRLIGISDTYNEKLGLYYSSGFVENKETNRQNTHLYVHSKYDSLVYKRKEFDYVTRCNAEGLRDIDHPFEKDKSEYRIICLGNSFTEGVGTSQDSSWSKLLENHLKIKTKRKITVFNAGVSGSDPFYEYMLLKERMLKYHPDLVLVSLGLSDIEFHRCRGGFERFTVQGVQYRNAPGWEKLYAVSYVVRFITDFILKYDYFLSPADFKAERTTALTDIKECIYRFNELSLKQGFKLAIIFYDDGSNQYTTLMTKLKRDNIIPIIDLFEYNKNIEKLNDNSRKAYFWPIDGHFNSKGYNMFARGVEWNLKKMGIIDSL